MHPTPDELLRAIQRRLGQVKAEAALTPVARDALDDAERLLRRLERTWSHRLPFLVVDNRLAVDLLRSLAPHLPELSAEIDAAAAKVEGAGSGEPTMSGADEPPVDEPTVHDLNKQLQGLLGRAVHLLPDDADGDTGRARIADHLRARLAANPALNRTPSDRRPTVSDQQEDPAP